MNRPVSRLLNFSLCGGVRDLSFVLWLTMPIELPDVESFAARAGHASGELLCMFELMSSEEWLENQWNP